MAAVPYCITVSEDTDALVVKALAHRADLVRIVTTVGESAAIEAIIISCCLALMDGAPISDSRVSA